MPNSVDARPKRAVRSLPIAAGGTRIRRSRAGLWRAGVLIAVHALVALHIAHWQFRGTTISPLEPSEGMEFGKHGVINAGFIFFALMILSTLIFGRWFCGWACHIVALQDLSRWLLAKIGIRPKPIRSSVLGLVPTVAFLYMFVSPLLLKPAASVAGAAARLPIPVSALARSHIELGAQSEWAIAPPQLTTESFWATFPGPLMAVLTFLVVGFVIIYALGAKGFCFTGCPYGAIFGVADRFAPMRIRVTDDCTGSGHCTAVCTSNVRVHEEVRDFRMVVDSGCMKCLDCVQVCPNDALYVGWGAPALKPVAPAAPKPIEKLGQSGVWRWLLSALFALLVSAAFHGFDLPHRFRLDLLSWSQSALVAGAAVFLLVLFRSRARSPRGCTLGEEALLALFFLTALLAFRGWHGIPFLFSLGLSAVIAWTLTQACLLISRRQLSLHGFRLKREGRLQPAAAVFGLLVAALLTLGTYASVAQARQIATQDMILELGNLRAALATDESPAALERTITLQRTIHEREPHVLDHTLGLGFLLTRAGRLDEAQALYDATLADRAFASDGRIQFQYGMLESIRPRPAEAMRRFREAVRLAPNRSQHWLTLAQATVLDGDVPGGLALLDQAAARFSKDVDVQLAAGLASLQLGDAVRARRYIAAASALAPQREDVKQAAEALRSKYGEAKP
jgi:tetratricopeptide (TPR) repeat protein/ferredoxin